MTGLPVPTPLQGSPGVNLSPSVWNANVHDGLTFLLNPPLTQLYASASQSIPSGGSGAIIALDTAVTDLYGGFSSSAHTWTAPVTGWYNIQGHLHFAGNGTGTRAAWINVNGSYIANSETWGSVQSTQFTLSTETVTLVAAGQTVSLTGFQSSGAALATVVASNTYGALTIRFLHA